MTLKDYYIANADNKEKYILYEIIGNGRCDMCSAPAGTTYEEAERMLNRMMNNPTEDDKEFLSEYKDFKIIERELLISNGRIFPTSLDRLLEKIPYNN